MISLDQLKSVFIIPFVFAIGTFPHLSFSQAKPQFFYYIGGGEPLSQNPTATHFDYSFNQIKNLEKSSWKTHFLFAGDQIESQKLRQKVQSQAQSLTENHLASFLEEIKSTLALGKLDGGQLLIYLDTHGEWDGQNYSIKTIDGKVDIRPSLKKIRSLAKDHDVKFALVGATCFSGQLIQLADDKTCVVTTSPSDTPGLMMNNNVLSYLLGSQRIKNLEELHLQGRQFRNIDMGQPLISTSAGQRAFQLLKEMRTSLLLTSIKKDSEISEFNPIGLETTVAQLKNLSSLIPEKMLIQLQSLSDQQKILLQQHRESAFGSRLKIRNQLNKVSRQLGSLERELYAHLYEVFSKESAEPNVCQDFKT